MSLPYFPLYPTDFEADTSHLTLAEDGAYNRLLRLMWMTPGCSLPDDDQWIMRRMRVDQDTFDRVVLVVISEFFKRKGGRVLSPRLARIFEESSLAHKKRISAGSKGGKAKALKTNKPMPSNALAMPKQPEPEPEPYIKEDTNVSLSESVKSDFLLAVEIYNEAAAVTKWPVVQTHSKKRQSACNARLKECGGIDGWTVAIDKARESHFLTGQTDRPFFATFDWISKPDNFTKIMEGHYDNRTSNQRQHGIGSSQVDAFAAVAANRSGRAN